jgi:hypothetical protein
MTTFYFLTTLGDVQADSLSMNGIRGNIPFSSSRPAAQEPTGPYVRIP